MALKEALRWLQIKNLDKDHLGHDSESVIGDKGEAVHVKLFPEKNIL